MRQIVRFNKVIKELIITGDFVMLNLVLSFVCFVCKNLIINSHISDVSRDLFILFNFCYLICVYYSIPIIHNRVVRPEKIVARVIATTTFHVVLCTVVMSSLHIGFSLFKFLLVFYPLFTVILIAYRLTFRYFIKQYRRVGGNSRTVVFVGTNDNMKELYHEMADDPTSGFHVIGYFDDSLSKEFSDKIPHLGKVGDAINTLPNMGVEQLYCCLPSSRGSEVLSIINYCENHLIRFYSAPNIRNYMKRPMHIEMLGEIPVLYIREEPLLRVENRLVKRTFDIVLSLGVLCIIFPIVYIIVGIVIKTTSPGPIFFKQKRNGEDGEEFWCYKFRSMKVNKDSDMVQATKHDPRKTKFGEFLRKSSLDEFPQFINVFMGNMSVVGPRPHMLKHTEEYSRLINKYMVRHLVKPGITGWAQVSGYRGETKTIEEMEGRVKRDIWYLEHWTFWLDIRIIFLTIKNAVKGETKAY